MIEKLDKFNLTEASIYHAERLYAKVNEIIDAVNGILAAQEQYATIYKEDIMPMLTPENEEPVDKFAEQRKWIGKLCKFRDNPACTWKYGILKEICEYVEFPFWDIDCYEYAECELVKPDDDVIYKGE